MVDDSKLPYERYTQMGRAGNGYTAWAVADLIVQISTCQ